MENPVIKYAQASTDHEELSKIQEALEYGYFGQAYLTEQFEKELANYLETDRYVVSCNTGTSALHLSMEALGITNGDEVIVPSFTFAATIQAIIATGASPVFCDVDAKTGLIDPEVATTLINTKTKAIVVVHYSGTSCDMNTFLRLKDQYGIRIIEDAAHAIGTKYQGKFIGSFGDITCFSFDSIKVMTCGEGGAVVTSSKSLQDRMRAMRLLGIERENDTSKNWKKRSAGYEISGPGFRYHMSNINAAIGLVQLTKLTSFIQRRRDICEMYIDKLRDIYEVEYLTDNVACIAPFLFTIKLSGGRRDELKLYLRNNNVETNISYVPNHYHKYFDKFRTSNLKETEDLYDRILCLPLHPNLQNSDVEKVCYLLKSFYSAKN